MILTIIVHRCTKCNSTNIVRNGTDYKGDQKFHCHHTTDFPSVSSTKKAAHRHLRFGTSSSIILVVRMSGVCPFIQPQFDMEACTGCGLCEKLCPYAALTVDMEEGNRVDEAYCLGCGMCVGQCTEDAIKLVHLATGNVVWENRGLHRIWVKD